MVGTKISRIGTLDLLPEANVNAKCRLRYKTTYFLVKNFNSLATQQITVCKVSSYRKKKIIKFMGEIDISAVIVGDF